jgi:baseplate J-like protein
MPNVSSPPFSPSIVSPNLDDKTYAQLRDEALALARRRAPAWTDQSPHDPGVVLLELFAYLTETLLFRVNRLPRKVYVEFLKLIGLRLQPPATASVLVTFSAGEPATRRIQIPRGTRIGSSRDSATEPVVFVTDEVAWIEPGQTEVRVVARHREVIEAERLGVGSGAPGLALRASRPPLVASVTDAVVLRLGVEALPSELTGAEEKIHLGDKLYRVWKEVEGFALPAEDPNVYMVDRVSGVFSFAPALEATVTQGEGALGAVPGAGREILVWYSRGGGAAGNVAAGALDMLKDGNLAGIKSVRNDADATGGRNAETIENALVRGPAELHSLKRAVTARDFESLVMRERGGIALVKAFAERDLWKHARPGTVDVVLVPDIPEEERGASHEHVTAIKLREKQGQPELDRIQKLLDGLTTIGTNTVVRYGALKSVSVTATVGIAGTQDPAMVQARLQSTLYRALSPLAASGRLRRGFGDPLRVGDIYGILQAEPGVAFLNKVSLQVDLVPEGTNALVVDPSQPGTWYAGCDNGLFRSTNRADSWEQVFPGEEGPVDRVAIHPAVPGLLGIVTRGVKEGDPCRLHVSRSSGESWSETTLSLQKLTDIAWTVRDGVPILLVAAETGLYEARVTLTEGPVPGASFGAGLLPVQVDAKRQPGFWAVACTTDERGTSLVALATIDAPFGIYLSAAAGATNTFKDIGLRNENVRVLAFQRLESVTYLWAGTNQPGREDGKGCFRREMDSTATPARPWDPVADGWNGSSVNGLAFQDSRVYAASYQRGVMSLDGKAAALRWQPSGLGAGLPEDQIETGRYFHPLRAIAAEAGAGGGEPLVITGGANGMFRRQPRSEQSPDRDTYVKAAPKEVEQVLVPRDWLLCSGTHTVLDSNASHTD